MVVNAGKHLHFVFFLLEKACYKGVLKIVII